QEAEGPLGSARHEVDAGKARGQGRNVRRRRLLRPLERRTVRARARAGNRRTVEDVEARARACDSAIAVAAITAPDATDQAQAGCLHSQRSSTMFPFILQISLQYFPNGPPFSTVH